MCRHSRRSILVAVISFWCVLALGAEGPRRILILHSYHPGYDWTDTLQQTFSDRFGEDTSVELYIEFMDTQRRYVDGTFNVLDALYRHRYVEAEVHFDVILATDDPALDFLFERKHQLFGSTPVVFSGINNLDTERLVGRPDYTGVNETVDIVKTIDLALQLRPMTRRIAVISDDSFTGRLNVEIFSSARSSYEPDIEFITLYNLSEPALVEALSVLDESDAILYLSYFRAPDGSRISVQEGFDLISRSTNAPVFSLWDFAIHAGALGGVVASSQEQANAAADIAFRILAGESPADIPPEMESPNVPMFNYLRLRRAEIPIRELPAGSVLYNWRPTVVRLYWPYFAGALLFLTLQSALIIGLLRSRVRMRRTRSELRKRQQELSDSLADKEALLKEVHHRVKNNLQVVASLVSLSGAGDERTTDLLRDIRQRVLAMAQIHERLYQSNDFARIDLSGYARHMVNEISTVYNWIGAQIVFNADEAPVHLTISQAVPCGLILTEVLTNAFKHAFPAGSVGPSIAVSIHGEGEEVEMVVRDNGVGFPVSVDHHSTKTTGLAIINALASQLRAVFDITSGNGTSISIRFTVSV